MCKLWTQCHLEIMCGCDHEPELLQALKVQVAALAEEEDGGRFTEPPAERLYARACDRACVWQGHSIREIDL